MKNSQKILENLIKEEVQKILKEKNRNAMLRYPYVPLRVLETHLNELTRKDPKNIIGYKVVSAENRDVGPEATMGARAEGSHVKYTVEITVLDDGSPNLD